MKSKEDVEVDGGTDRGGNVKEKWLIDFNLCWMGGHLSIHVKVYPSNKFYWYREIHTYSDQRCNFILFSVNFDNTVMWNYKSLALLKEFYLTFQCLELVMEWIICSSVFCSVTRWPLLVSTLIFHVQRTEETNFNIYN